MPANRRIVIRVDDLQNSLPKVLLFKAFDEGISVMEFVTTRSRKPRCALSFYIFNLSQPPVVPVTAYVQMSMTFKPSHLILGMKRIPLGVALHVVRRVYAALPTIRKVDTDSGFPIFSYGVKTRHPFERISSTRPHIVVAANENQRVHAVNQPFN
jgi:hypothetical protein